MLRTILLLLGLLLTQIGFAVSPPPIEVPVHAGESIQARLMGRSLYLLQKAEHLVNEENVLSGSLDADFVLSDRDIPNKGLLSSEQWVRFTLQNTSSETLHLFLESRYSFLDNITLYQKKADGTYQSLTLGDVHDYEKRPIEFRLPVFPLEAAPGANTYYIRIQTQGTLMVALFLWDTSSFQSYNKRDTLTLGLAYGSILILLIYNAFLAVSFRSRTYAFYVIYLVAYLAHQFGLQATGVAWLGGRAGQWTNNEGFIASVALHNVLSCIFASSFLNASRYMPRLQKFVFLLNLVNGSILLIPFFGEYNLAARLLTSATIVTSLTLIGMGLTAGFRGFRPAIYYTLAWTFLLTGNILLSLMFNGLFPMNAVVQYGNLYGGVIEVAFISLALADRVTYLQKKSEKTITHLNDELTKNIQRVEALVAERTETIRTIIDNVRSGFFTMTPDLRIEAGFTRSCEALLGRKLEPGLLVSEALHMEPGEAQVFRMAAQQVFEDIMHDEVAISQIPKTYRIGKKTFSLEGSVVRDQKGKVKLILFTLMDVSRLKRKQKEAFRSSMLLRIIRNIDAFRSFITYTRDSLEGLKQVNLKHEQTKANFVLHTIKGNSLVFNLNTQARLIHQIEEKEQIDTDDIDAIIESFYNFLERHRDILNISWGAEHEEHFVVGQSSLDALQKYLDQRLQDPSIKEQVTQWMREITAKSARSLLGPIHDDIQHLAQRLHKQVKLIVEGDEEKIINEHERELVKNLMHLLRNALVHGIEADRAAVHKPAEGQIRLSIQSTPEQLHIVVADDGAGFPMELLRSSVREKRLMSAEQAQEATLAELLETLATQGFSTADQASIYAGRGIGLAAVYQAVADCRGHIEVDHQPGKGCRFTLRIPRQRSESSNLLAS
jgi:signal transduction histidine kinase